MATPFDPLNYSLDPTDPSLSLSDALKLSRDEISQVNPDLAGNLNQRYGPPTAAASPAPAPATDGEQPQIGAEDTSVHGGVAPSTDIIQALLTGKDGPIDPKMQKALIEALDQINPLKPKETIGSPKVGEFLTGVKGGQGGIMGLGIQPIDILAFALGAAITSRLPQDKAIATTMAIAKMPGELRATQMKSVKDYIGTVQKTIQEQRQAAQLQGTNIANATKLIKTTQAWSQTQKQASLMEMMRQGKLDLADPKTRAMFIDAGYKGADLNAIQKIKDEGKGPSVGTEAELLATSQGFASYQAAPTEVKKQIANIIEHRKIEDQARADARLAQMIKAGDRTQGRLDIQTNKALSNVVSIDSKSALMDDEVVDSKNPFTAAHKKGMVYLDQAHRKQLDASNLALTQLIRLRRLTDELFKGVKPGTNLVNALAMNGKARLGDEGVRAFRTLLLETLPSNAQAGGYTQGAAGRIGIIKIEKEIMPNESDTQASLNDPTKGKYAILTQRFKNNRQIAFGGGIDASEALNADQQADTMPEGVSIGKSQKVK